MKIRELFDLMEQTIAEKQNAGDDQTTYADGSKEPNSGSTVGANPPQNAGDDKTTTADGEKEKGGSTVGTNPPQNAGDGKSKEIGKKKSDDDADDEDVDDKDEDDEDADDEEGKKDDKDSDDDEDDDEVVVIEPKGKGKQEDGSADVGFTDKNIDNFVDKASSDKNAETKAAYKNAPEQGKGKSGLAGEPGKYEVPAKDDPAAVHEGINWEALKRLVRS